jgi:hypothetical protein
VGLHRIDLKSREPEENVEPLSVDRERRTDVCAN